MAYATVDELAAKLRIRVTAENTDTLQRCLDAAAAEIDADLDRIDPLPDPPPGAITETNLNRAVEWFKSADSAYGMVGFEAIGVLHAPKDGFGRHAQAITPYKQQFGIA